MQTPIDSAGVLAQATLVFLLALALALVIERILEILKAAWDLLDSRADLYRFWTKRAQRARDYLERRLRIFEYVDEKKAASLLDRFSEMMLGPQHGFDGQVPVISGNLVRAVWVRLAAKLLGMAIGVALAFLLDLNLLRWLSDRTPLPGPAGIALTGALLGLGSGPVHKVITEIEKRRQKRAGEVAGA